MAEGTSNEDSNERKGEVQGSSPSHDFPPSPDTSLHHPLVKLNINNNEEHVGKTFHSVDAPLSHIQLKRPTAEIVMDNVSLVSAPVKGDVDLPENVEDISEVQELSLLSCGEENGSSNESSGGPRRHSKSSSLPHGVKLCPEGPTVTEKGVEPPPSSQAEEKWVKLEEELRKAQEDLQAKDDEVEELKGIRQRVEDELHDLTSSLFLEAHKMVSEAKMKEISSEKSLRETKMQLDGLQAEVTALKALLITSTPSRPNLGNGGMSIFKKQHKRTPSHNHLLYGRSEESDGKTIEVNDQTKWIDRERSDIDPILHELFAKWRTDPTLIKSRSHFLKKIYEEDIEPCIQFANKDLVRRLMVAIEENSIWVDPLPEKSKTPAPRECALLQIPRLCHYRMSFDFDSDEWFDISQLCRDRVAAVCEFLNYLRYMKNGLVKASVDDSYWEIIRLRKQMALAKLGLPISS